MRPEAIDFDKTFLRAHLREKLADTSEVFALGYLLARAPLERRAEAAEWLTLRGFFYGLGPEGAEHYPGVKLYRPVGVTALEPKEGDTHRSWGELSQLLAHLDNERSTEGVLLVARSGSGKTVAEIKAMCDCFWADEGGQDEPKQPLLAGFLPCRLTADGTVPERDVLETLLARAARLPKLFPAKAVRRYFETGPKLLLFCDLNAVPLGHRQGLVNALVAFQQDERHLGRRHRVVVAFRSARADDPLLTQLKDGGLFRSYDLKPLPIHAALDYLDALRSVEEWLDRKLGVRTGERDLAAQHEQVRKLAATPGKSVIDTPLIMHFVSILSDEALLRVHKLVELYDEVVVKILEDRRRYAKQMQGSRVAMPDFGGADSLADDPARASHARQRRRPHALGPQAGDKADAPSGRL